MRKPAPRPKAHTTKKAHDTTGAGKKMKPFPKSVQAGMKKEK